MTLPRVPITLYTGICTAYGRQPGSLGFRDSSNEMSQLQMQTNRKWTLHMISTEKERRKDSKDGKGKERGNKYEGS